jgi:hypothetical protein
MPKSKHNNHFIGAGRNVSTQKRLKTEYKMEAADSSEMMLTTSQIAWCH